MSEMSPKLGREPVTSYLADECVSHSATVNRAVLTSLNKCDYTYLCLLFTIPYLISSAMASFYEINSLID